jgi:Zn finger protein HypA/HybF involved in hydrogenase expression
MPANIECWNCGHTYDAYDFSVCPDCKEPEHHNPKYYTDDFDTQIQAEELHEEDVEEDLPF